MLKFMTNRIPSIIRPLTRVVSPMPVSPLSSLTTKQENFSQSSAPKYAYMLLGAAAFGLAGKVYYEKRKQEQQNDLPNEETEQGDKYVAANMHIMKKEIQSRGEILRKHHITVEPWVKHNDYAYLSARVYSDYENDKKSGSYDKSISCMEESWEKYKDSSSILAEKDQKDYYGIAYINHAAKEIIIAHKGIQFSIYEKLEVFGRFFGLGIRKVENRYGNFIFDFVSNMTLPAQQFSEHIWKETDADPVLRTYARSHTGYSSGGLLAAVVASYEARVNNTQRGAVTFDSPGPYHLFMHMYGSIFHPKLYLTNYVAEPNSINTLSHQVGTVFRIYPYKYRRDFEPLASIIPSFVIPFHDVIFLSSLLGYGGREFLRRSLSIAGNTLLQKTFRILLHSSLIPTFCIGAGVWEMAKYQGVKETNTLLSILAAVPYLLFTDIFKNISDKLYSTQDMKTANFKQWISANYGRMFKESLALYILSGIMACAAVIGSQWWVELTYLLNTQYKERFYAVFNREASGDTIRSQRVVASWPAGGRSLFGSFIVAYIANSTARKTTTFDLDEFIDLRKDTFVTTEESMTYYEFLVDLLLNYYAEEIARYILPLNNFNAEAQQFLKEYQENSDEALKKYPQFNDYKGLLNLCRIEKVPSETDPSDEILAVHLVQQMSKPEFEKIKQAREIKIKYPLLTNSDNAEIEISYAFTIHEFRDWINRQCARSLATSVPVPIPSKHEKPGM